MGRTNHTRGERTSGLITAPPSHLPRRRLLHALETAFNNSVVCSWLIQVPVVEYMYICNFFTCIFSLGFFSGSDSVSVS